MKKIATIIIISLVTIKGFAQHGIGTNSPNSNSVLHLESADSSQGVIIPKVTTIKRPIATNAIKGMMIFNVTDNLFQMCNGTEWLSITSDSLTDHDFYKVGTTQAPQSINDNIFTNGNLGIGTTNPNVNLEIKDITADPKIRIQNDGSASFHPTLELYRNASDFGAIKQLTGGTGMVIQSFRTGDDNKINFLVGSSSNSKMTIDHSGNVGVGIVNPIGNFHVNPKGNTIGYTSLLIGGDDTNLNTEIAEIGFRRSNYNPNENAAAIVLYRKNSGAEGGLRFKTQANSSTLNTALDITPEGNIGIGTTSPTAKLKVYDPSIASPQVILTGNGGQNAGGIQFSSNTSNFIKGGPFYPGMQYGSSSHHTWFNASTNPMMRITSAGRVGIGTTNPAGILHINNNSFVRFDTIAGVQTRITSLPSTRLTFYHDLDFKNLYNYRIDGSTNDTSGFVFSSAPDSPDLVIRNGIDNIPKIGIGVVNPIEKLTVNGNIAPASNNIYSLGTATLKWNEIYATNGVINTSDKRLKTNISPLSYGLNEIKKLNTVTYNWKKNNNGKRIGFIAQELQQIIPEVITTANDSAKTLGVRYTELIPVLTKAIQEQQQIIEELKSENNNLKNVNTNNSKKLIMLEDQLNEIHKLLKNN